MKVSYEDFGLYREILYVDALLEASKGDLERQHQKALEELDMELNSQTRRRIEMERIFMERYGSFDIDPNTGEIR